jgi:hypothetical protein
MEGTMGNEGAGMRAILIACHQSKIAEEYSGQLYLAVNRRWAISIFQNPGAKVSWLSGRDFRITMSVVIY